MDKKRLMKIGFTLIEILVSITIVAIISGGALIVMNNFSSQQKLNKSRDEMISYIKLTQSYAKTRQPPAANPGEVLHHISLYLVTIDGKKNIKSEFNGDGNKYYFQNQVTNSEIDVGLNPSPIIFWPGGKLSHDASGNLYSAGETATVTVANYGQSGDAYQIIINSLGQIKETFLVSDSLIPTSVPTTPTPTLMPSATPIPWATPTDVQQVTACSTCPNMDTFARACFGVSCLGMGSCVPQQATCGNNNNCYTGSCIDGSQD